MLEVGPDPELPEGRVALLFTDIQGSTALLQSLGEAYGEVLNQHDEIMRETWSRFGGVEVDNEGDAFFVAFREAQAAVEAAIAVQHRFAEHPWPARASVRVRMGLHAGEPRVRGRTYWGIDVNYAARLCSAAHGGQVLMSASMRAQAPESPVESVGEHGLKDFPAARELFHLIVNGARATDFPPPRTLSTIRSNIPSVATPILGRDSVLAELRGRLTDGATRLVTLVGPGGMGKTRTAVASGEELTREFRDGVAFVPLASLTNLSSAVAAIVDAVQAQRISGVAPELALEQHLRSRQLLLVLDNAEHLPEIAPLVGQLLAGAPELQVLVTSQAPLGVRAETVVRLEPLTEEPAIEMFLDRARAKDPSFSLTEGNSAAVSQLCRRLEGLPLALELAASRAPLTGVDGLLAALDRGPEVLGRGSADHPARQQGLRAALDWTVSLLTDDERLVFAGQGAFAAAWTLPQTEELFSGEIEEFDMWTIVARLVDLSLVVARGDGRFTMAERVRRHAHEVLRDSGVETMRRRRHAELMAADMEQRGLEVSLDLRRVVANIDDAVDETLHALAWAKDADPDLFRNLLALAAYPLAQVGRIADLAPDIIRLTDEHNRRGDRMDGYLLLSRGVLDGFGLSDPALALAPLWAAKGCFEEFGTQEDQLLLSYFLAETLRVSGQVGESRALVLAALESAATAGDPRWVELFEGEQIPQAIQEGKYAEAERMLEKVAARPGRADIPATFALSYWADCAYGKGDFATALRRYAEMLRTLPYAQLENMLFQIQGVAVSLAELGRDEEAAELLAGIDHVYYSRSGRDLGLIIPSYAESISALNERLPEAAATAARARGRELDYAQLYARALQVEVE